MDHNAATRSLLAAPAALLATTLAALSTGGCRGESSTAPTSHAVVTFAVLGETFRVSLTTADQIAAAHAAERGGPARIPIGRIVPGQQVNAGSSWHLEELAFAETTIELCDGRPSDVERDATRFGGGSFCPWMATLVQIDER